MRKSVIVPIAAVIGLAALRFWQIPTSSLADADGYLTQVSAIAPFDHVTVWRVFSEIAGSYRAQTTGWFPVAPIPLGIWLLDPSQWLAKVIQYLLVLVSFGFFAYVALKTTKSPAAAIFASVVALCCWQYRSVHDPTVGTSFLAPWTAILMLASFAAWLAYRDSFKLWQLLACYALLAAALLTGAVAWGLGATLFALAIVSNRRLPAVGILVILAGSIALTIWVDAPHAPWLHAGSYAQNVLLQLFAALPASFRAAGHLPIARIADLWHGTRYNDDRFTVIAPITFLGWLTVAFLSATAFLTAQLGLSKRIDGATWQAIVAGLGLWLVPAFALGAPGEWQHGLPPGQGFGGVYFQYFGFALLVTAAAWLFMNYVRRQRALLPAFAALCVLIVSYGNCRADSTVLRDWARADAPREAIQRAGSAGFFDQLPSGTTIVLSPSIPFPSRVRVGVANPKYAFYHYTGKRFDVLSAENVKAYENSWILQTPKSTGFLVALLHVTRSSALGLPIDRALGYTVLPQVWNGAAGTRLGVTRDVVPLRDGASIAARRLCGPVAANVEDAFGKSRPTLLWGPGFYHSGPYGYDTGLQTTYWGVGRRTSPYPKMYMGSRASLTILPSSCAPPASIDIELQAFGNGPSDLAVDSFGHTLHLTVPPFVPTNFSLHYRLVSRKPIRIRFSTNAPLADLDPILQRYERDRPRFIRMMLEVASVRESSPTADKTPQ